MKLEQNVAVPKSFCKNETLTKSCRSRADHVLQGDAANATSVPGGTARYAAEEAQSQDYQPM